jgi:hypothetical protein
MANTGKPGFGPEFTRRGLELRGKERGALKALEELLRAYREDNEREGHAAD